MRTDSRRRETGQCNCVDVYVRARTSDEADTCIRRGCPSIVNKTKNRSSVSSLLANKALRYDYSHFLLAVTREF